MKYAALFLFLFFSNTSFAEDTSVSAAVAEGDEIVGKIKEQPPEKFKDGEITLQTKDGGALKYNSNDYKVVPRYKYLRKKAEPKVEIKTVETLVQKKNQVTLHLGIGNDGISTKNRDDGKVDVSLQRNAVIGLGYNRYIDDTWSVSGTVLSNKTVTLGAGFSW